MHSAPPNRYELISCGWGGHVLVGVDAATVTDADAAVVRDDGGLRWHRCLRCDSWVPRRRPVVPAMDRVPPRVDIELPLRGPLLRDRYVLRLIALDRALHVVLLSALAFVIFFFVGNHAALQRDYQQIVNAFGGPARPHAFLGRLRHYFSISSAHLDAAGAGVVFFAVLEAVEMVGLWLTRRWAEYLTFVATTLLLPLEIYELTTGVSVLKLLTLAINVAVVAYLLWAKRLFGVHGGWRAEEQRRRAAGWEALDSVVAPAPS